MSDVRHIQASAEWWKGRQVIKNVPSQYWYQKVQLAQLDELKETSRKAVGIIGYASDEGVRRNQGRVGASKGPNAIRERLAKLAFHHDDLLVYDFGDIAVDNEMEAGQKLLGDEVYNILKKDIFPIVIGGGHDVAFGHFLGIHKQLTDHPEKRLGILNIDAHFDLRIIEDQPNSGTPFYQISQMMEQMDQVFDYFVLGIQPPANTPKLFQTAKKLQTKYILSEDCTMDRLRYINAMISSLLDRNDAIYLSIDMDAFSSAYAPGVSASSPMGISPYFALEVLSFLIKSGKVISCDIAEVNPKYDRDEQTSVLAARIIDSIAGLIERNKG